MNFQKTIFLIFCFPLLLFSTTKELPFVIVIASYNNKDWYRKNLDSIFDQKYNNYRVIYVSDGSTDETGELVEAYVKQKGQGFRFTLIKNKEYSGPLAGMAQAAYLCSNNEIIVDVDGNDWLANSEVLAYLNAIYADPNVWMTYGQFSFYPEMTEGFAKEIPSDVIKQNTFRTLRGVVTHLKTFYAGLFQQIEKEDFFWVGNFIPKAGDMAYTIPILEMSGRHTKLITEVLYNYNRSSPINEHKLSNKLETNLDQFIRNKKKYAPLAQLPLEPATLSAYCQIPDITHPTLIDYFLVQNFLTFGQKDEVELLREAKKQALDFKIVGPSSEEIPYSGVIPVNCNFSEKENCIALYSPFNGTGPQHLRQLIELITKSDFKGHILYHCGGWPHVEKGLLVLAHVPFAYKVCAFQEARHLGYKRVLWMDPSVVPVVGLNHIFMKIVEKGVFALDTKQTIGNATNLPSVAFFGLSLRQAFNIPLCSTSIFGVDFETDKGQRIIDWWLKAAQDKNAYFSPRPDQNSLSIILNKLGISDLIENDKIAPGKNQIRPDSLFYLNQEETP